MQTGMSGEVLFDAELRYRHGYRMRNMVLVCGSPTSDQIL